MCLPFLNLSVWYELSRAWRVAYVADASAVFTNITKFQFLQTRSRNFMDKGYIFTSWHVSHRAHRSSCSGAAVVKLCSYPRVVTFLLVPICNSLKACNEVRSLSRFYFPISQSPSASKYVTDWGPSRQVHPVQTVAVSRQLASQLLSESYVLFLSLPAACISRRYWPILCPINSTS
jgi:hypothetical protein